MSGDKYNFLKDGISIEFFGQVLYTKIGKNFGLFLNTFYNMEG